MHFNEDSKPRCINSHRTSFIYRNNFNHLRALVKFIEKMFHGVGPLLVSRSLQVQLVSIEQASVNNTPGSSKLVEHIEKMDAVAIVKLGNFNVDVCYACKSVRISSGKYSQQQNLG